MVLQIQKKMTPERQKAEELVNEFKNHHTVVKGEEVKCAIICVKNIIDVTKENPLKQFYWKKVLEELENM